MPCCCAFQCTSRSEHGFTLLTVPRRKDDIARRNKWILNIGRKDFVPTKRTVVCELHFAADQFEPLILERYGKKKLKPNAVPTIFSHLSPPEHMSPAAKRLPLANKSVPTKEYVSIHGTSADQGASDVPIKEYTLIRDISGEPCVSNVPIKKDTTIHETSGEQCISDVPTIEEPEVRDSREQPSFPEGHNAVFVDRHILPDDSRVAGVEEHTTRMHLNSMPHQEAVVGLEREQHIVVGSATADLSDGRHKCRFCGKAFPNQYRLECHVLIHTCERPFQCHLCPMVFHRKATLTAHLHNHKGERPFQCHFCPMDFNEKRHLTDHLRIHTGERPFQCHICRKGFRQKFTLKKHLRIHSYGRLFQCHFCMVCFKQEGTLNRHLQVHRSRKPFQCHLCPMNFSRKCSLTYHLRSHTCDKLFKCHVQRGALLEEFSCEASAVT